MNGPRARDGAPLETVGIYDAIPRRIPDVPKHERSLLDEGKKLARHFVKRIEWDRERVKYWIGTGAQPTKRVAWLLQKVRIINSIVEVIADSLRFAGEPEYETALPYHLVHS
jgi:small subunit ribosomal protein S16